MEVAHLRHGHAEDDGRRNWLSDMLARVQTSFGFIKHKRCGPARRIGFTAICFEVDELISHANKHSPEACKEVVVTDYRYSAELRSSP
ncbi:hypothetical protein GCM10027396_18840 [Insolitispirillum peregrinum]